MPSPTNVKKQEQAPQFAHVANTCDNSSSGAKHSIGIDVSGTAYSWGSNNNMGQLGRSTGKASQPHPVKVLLSNENNNDTSPLFIRGFVGGDKESGHSALLDTTRTRLYMAGCDRWQQLGLGSSSGGASGYTWTDGGRIWRNEFVFLNHLQDFLGESSGTCTIRETRVPSSTSRLAKLTIRLRHGNSRRLLQGSIRLSRPYSSSRM